MTGIRDQQYNKGEWAELYVFMKLLGDGRLYAADRQLRRRDDSYLDVQKIVREENKGVVTEYLPDGSGRIKIVRNGSSQAEVQSSDFLDNAVTFFDYLKESRGSSFPAPEGIAKFADSILVTKPKSPSVSRKGPFGGKSDIIMQMLDGRNAMISTMGFSIKSQFGQAPTLYNAGTSTQFLFEMCGMNDSSMEKFNSLIDAQGKRRWKDCVELISRENIDLTFLGTEHDILRENLLYIRESMAGILAWMLRERLVVGYEDSGSKGIKEICSKMSKANPMNYKNTKLYEKIVKDFLFAAFAGLTGGRPWNGEEQVNGGYIVVKPNGEVLCYHANDREEFRDYLFRSTFIEYVSCKKYRWGFVRKDNQNRYVLPINGSIRFFKDVEQRT